MKSLQTTRKFRIIIFFFFTKSKVGLLLIYFYCTNYDVLFDMVSPDSSGSCSLKLQTSQQASFLTTPLGHGHSKCLALRQP